MTTGTVTVTVTDKAGNHVSGTVQLTVSSTWPTATSTGYAAAGYPTPTQTFNATSINAPTTITNKIVTGQVAVYSDDVTFKGCVFTAAGQNGQIKLRAGFGNLTVQDCDMGGDGVHLTQYCVVADDIPAGKPVSILRNKMTHWSDAMQLNGVGGGTVSGNYVGQTTYFSGDHTDGYQCNGGGQNFTIQHNTFETALAQTSCLALFQDFPGNYSNVLVDSNRFAGGGYAVYCAPQPAGTQVTNVRYTNNVFSTQFYPQCGYYGPGRNFVINTGNVWSNNTWQDGPNAGQTIAAPG